MKIAEFFAHPLPSVALTLGTYAFALALNRRLPWVHPLLFCCAALMVFLLAARVLYAAYKSGGDLITFWLGPATVALAVPLFRQRERICENGAAIGGAVLLGSFSGLSGAAFWVWILGGDRALVLSMLPKSATAPIAVEIARQLGGQAELTAVLTVLTGLVGSLVGPFLLRKCGVQSDVTLGIAMGTAAHGIGTARVLQDSRIQGAFAGLAMALTGIVTAVLAAILGLWLRP